MLVKLQIIIQAQVVFLSLKEKNTYNIHVLASVASYIIFIIILS